jgi:hypothetical protein
MPATTPLIAAELICSRVAVPARSARRPMSQIPATTPMAIISP